MMHWGPYSQWGCVESWPLIESEPYRRPDGVPLHVDTDYFGNPRAEANLFPGPFELSEGGKQRLKVWPVSIHAGAALGRT